MRQKIRELTSNEGLKARALRSSFWTIANYGGESVIRLASNLILTRLLFPEAFGMMALVQVVIAGLKMFSDTGVATSIMQHERGDDPDFLNTAWTIQLMRGIVLWLATCALALPAAAIYDEPMLAQLLPVAGLNAILGGLQPTNSISANRHLRLGRMTRISLIAQIGAILAMVLLAWAMKSVWALVLGGLFGGVLRNYLLRRYLPGIRNRLRWEPEAGHQLFHFGKYLFLSTAFGFLVNNADRAILGGYISMADLGVYNIAFFLASVPFMIAEMLTKRVVMPLYRMRPMTASEKNQKHIFRVRRMVIGVALALNLVLAFGGVFLINLMYDPRYTWAGPIVVMLSLVFVPRIVFVGSGAILLSQGDSKRFLYLVGSLAATQTAFMLASVSWLGIFGVIMAPAFGILVTSPLRILYSRRYEAWDSLGEGIFLALGLGLGLLACWLHRTEILALFG